MIPVFVRYALKDKSSKIYRLFLGSIYWLKVKEHLYFQKLKGENIQLKMRQSQISFRLLTNKIQMLLKTKN